MHLKKTLLFSTCLLLILATSGCTVVSVATTTASLAGTAVGVGVSAGSAVVSTTATVVKGASHAVFGDDEKAD